MKNNIKYFIAIILIIAINSSSTLNAQTGNYQEISKEKLFIYFMKQSKLQPYSKFNQNQNDRETWGTAYLKIFDEKNYNLYANDEFKINGLIQKSNESIRNKINSYPFFTLFSVENSALVGTYDFNTKSFPLNINSIGTGYRINGYLYFGISFSNSDSFDFQLKIPQEEASKFVERNKDANGNINRGVILKINYFVDNVSNELINGENKNVICAIKSIEILSSNKMQRIGAIQKKVYNSSNSDNSSCGSILTITHHAGDVAPENKTINYGVVSSNISGVNKCWITQNLGAERHATDGTGGIDDKSDASKGWYWQFNRKQGYSAFENGYNNTKLTPSTSWIRTIEENSDWKSENDPCTLLLGDGWRIPTKTEWENVINSNGWNPYKSVLKMHNSGFLSDSYGLLTFLGGIGYCWSSDQFIDSYGKGWQGWYVERGSRLTVAGKANGHSVRCLKDINIIKSEKPNPLEKKGK